MNLKLLVWLTVISQVFAFYSKYYRRCKLFNGNKFDLGNAAIEKVPEYGVDFNFPSVTKTTKELEYSHLDFIYN